MPNRIKYKPGDKIGLLTIIERAPNHGKKTFWYCNCDCGTQHFEIGTDTLSKKNKVKPCNCGCLNKQQIIKLGKQSFKDITGQQFGCLLALEPTEKRSSESIIWKCKCLSCGSIINVRSTFLRNRHTRSCGCLRSKGELKISNLLQENNINFQKEYIFTDFIYPNSNGIPRFDFYINNQYLIEYDGKTHFQSNGGWNTEENLKLIQLHDKYKNQYCKEHNIPLIRIPYYIYNTLTIQDLILETSKYVYTEGEK